MELTPRIKQILIYLLNAEQPATDSEVANALGVSKRTILREADYIAGILRSYDLTLVRKISTLLLFSIPVLSSYIGGILLENKKNGQAWPFFFVLKIIRQVKNR